MQKEASHSLSRWKMHLFIDITMVLCYNSCKINRNSVRMDSDIKE